MHSYCSNLLHVVFSTKQRRRCIVPEMRERLWKFMGGTARELGMKALVVDGVDDHAHLLLSLPPSLAAAVAIQKLKANSCRWVHQKFPRSRSFQWQKGYGAFSIGISQVEDTITYIKGQDKHHRRVDFREEFKAFLKKHGIEVREEL